MKRALFLLTVMTGTRILDTGREDGERSHFEFPQSRPFSSALEQPKSSQALFVFLICILGQAPFAAASDDTTQYANQVRPLLVTHCMECHSTEVQKAGFDLQRFATLNEVRLELESWQEILVMLESKEMPPEGKPQPSDQDREVLITWIRNLLRQEANLRAGDPGLVPVRRLNNAEYRYTIRDLTGIDLDPTKQFPTDGASGEGFLNGTDSLTFSPVLVDKYLDAAKRVASHAVLLPRGVRFSKFTFREEWSNEVLQEILDLYASYLTHLGEIPLDRYLATIITYRDELLSGQVSLEQVATRAKLSPKYLAVMYEFFTRPNTLPVMLDFQTEWGLAQSANRSLDDDGQIQSGSSLAAGELKSKIMAWQRILWQKQRANGHLVLEDRFVAVPVSLTTGHTFRFSMPDVESSEVEQSADFAEFYLAVEILLGDQEQPSVVLQNPRFESAVPVGEEGYSDPLPLRHVLKNQAGGEGGQNSTDALDPPEKSEWLSETRFKNNSEGLSAEKDMILLQGGEVVAVRVPAVAVSGREFVVEAKLSSEAGSIVLARFEVRKNPEPVRLERTLKWQDFQNPENLPLLVAEADEENRAQLQVGFDELRRVFPVKLCYPGVLVRDAVVTLERFHRGDRFLSELMLSPNEQKRLDELWSQLHFISQDAVQLQNSFETLIRGEMHPYQHVVQEIERRSKEAVEALRKSEPEHLDALLDFSRRAFRRPLEESESQELLDLYHDFRHKDFSHEEAFRSVLVRVLVSPKFLFRIEQPSDTGKTVQINEWELATRLSYFLWSTLPDQKLWQVAASGSLHDSEVLEQQVLRMLQDGKVRALATEFGAQWLEIRNFDSFQGKDEQRFPMFDADMRKSMYQEVILFFEEFFQKNCSAWDLIDADYTYLNGALAEFYGIPGVEGSHFRRIEGVQKFQRGGMLGWASVLAKHSGALRTSPVLRGNWISETVLGQRLPRPPPVVPELPDDEALGDLTIRELVERHTKLPECAACHDRIDPLGFALEGFDTVGRLRDRDLAGRPVDASAVLKDGSRFEGVSGLREYLRRTCGDEFLQQFCRKLLGYALGRRVLLSDQQLLNEMVASLKARDGEISSAVLKIVASRQFQRIRAPGFDEEGIAGDKMPVENQEH